MNNISDTVSVILCGVGGQGILLGSEITSVAAIEAGFDTKTNEVHGMAQRGGSVLGQIRYGKKVNSPLIASGEAAALASFEAAEAIRYAQFLRPGGLAVVSTQKIVPVTVSTGASKYPDDIEALLKKVFPRLCIIDAAGLAVKSGNIKAANTVILGALSTGLELPVDAWKRAIEKSVKPKFVELNICAFEEGRKAALAAQ